MVLIGLGIIALIIILLVGFYYCTSLKDLITECSPENRAINPNRAYLMLVPLFNVFYAFHLYSKISITVKTEFEASGEPQNGDYLKGIGATNAYFGLAGLLIPTAGFNVLLRFIGLIVCIIYWINVIEMKGKIRALPITRSKNFISNNSDLLD